MIFAFSTFLLLATIVISFGILALTRRLSAVFVMDHGTFAAVRRYWWCLLPWRGVLARGRQNNGAGDRTRSILPTFCLCVSILSSLF